MDELNRDTRISMRKLRCLLGEWAQKEARIANIKQEEVPNLKKEVDGLVEQELEKDKELLVRIYEANRRASASLGSKQKEEMVRIFLKVFRNLKSKTLEVPDMQIRNEKLTVGKNGFGLRWSKKSREITKYNDSAVFEIVANADKIATWMDDNRMKLQAGQLRRFAKYAEHLSRADLKRTYEVEPFKYPTYRYGSGDDIGEINSFTYEGGTITAFFEKENNSYGNSVTVMRMSSYDDEVIPKVESVYIYLMLRDTLKENAEEYVTRCNEIAENAEKNFAALKDEFVRELTLIDI